MKSKMIAAFAVATLGLQACTPPKLVEGSHSPVYSTDLQGKAASCTAPLLKNVEDGHAVPATIVTGGGGWCGLFVNREGKPFSAGLLTEAAHNGKVFVHTVGDDTRIDYTPRTASNGPDAFEVRLLPGDAVIHVAVNPPAPVAGK